jgi:Dihaem cytochrome c
MEAPDRMKPVHWLATVCGFALLTAGLTVARADDDREGPFDGRLAGPDVAPAADPLYVDECGACHFAYPPGLLPARSWEGVMTGLRDHFGDNAELAPDVAARLTRYLTEHAADRGADRRGAWVLRSLGANDAPLRITELPAFRGEHREIPARLVADNQDVGSLSRCEACHTRAARGYYNGRDVRIPGYGRWDD